MKTKPALTSRYETPRCSTPARLVMLALLTIGWQTASAAGQMADGQCGTVVDPELALPVLQKRAEMPLAIPIGLPSLWYFPLRVHIVRQSDGSGGLSQANLTMSLAQLDGQYAQLPFAFLQHLNVDYIDNDTFYDLPGQGEADQLRQLNNHPFAIDVYFVNSYGGLCGQSSFTWDSPQGVIMVNSCATNGSTVAHEIGHYFDLLHTHETATGVECPDGSNCEDAGDQFCSTPADPNLDDVVTDAPGCIYFGDAQSNCGEYNPQTDNLMSYAPKACRDLLTDEQRAYQYVIAEEVRDELFTMTIYVDGGSLNGGDGTPVDPFDTVAEGVSAAQPYLFISPGVYPETVTISTPTVIRRWGGPGAVLIGGSG